MKVADAENKLYGRFTNIVDTQTTVTNDKSKDNTVADETPQPGKAYPPDTQITLIIYKYQPLEPTCTTPPPGGGSGVPSTGPSGISTGSATGAALPPCTTP